MAVKKLTELRDGERVPVIVSIGALLNMREASKGTAAGRELGRLGLSLRGKGDEPDDPLPPQPSPVKAAP